MLQEVSCELLCIVSRQNPPILKQELENVFIDIIARERRVGRSSYKDEEIFLLVIIFLKPITLPNFVSKPAL